MGYRHRCKRCGGEWETSLAEPRRCGGGCGSALWDRERVRGVGAGRPVGKAGGEVKVAAASSIKKVGGRVRPVVVKAERQGDGQELVKDPEAW